MTEEQRFERLINAVWIAYKEAGCPYGDNVDAMLKWLEEKAEMAGGKN